MSSSWLVRRSMSSSLLVRRLLFFLLLLRRYDADASLLLRRYDADGVVCLHTPAFVGTMAIVSLLRGYDACLGSVFAHSWNLI